VDSECGSGAIPCLRGPSDQSAGGRRARALPAAL